MDPSNPWLAAWIERTQPGLTIEWAREDPEFVRFVREWAYGDPPDTGLKIDDVAAEEWLRHVPLPLTH